MEEYIVHLLILFLLYAILAESFVLTFGLGGLINLAHVSSYAIGAYATAILMVEYEWGFLSSLFAAGTCSMFLALPISFIAGKLKEDYFVIGTLAFSALVSALLYNWRSLTRGALGIPGIPRPEFLGIDFYQNSNYLFLLFSLAFVVCACLSVLFDSAWGRALRAQSENEVALGTLGSNVSSLKLYTLFISTFISGLAGAVFATYIGYIDPSSFQLNEMVFLISIIMLGGLRSFVGVLVAVAVLLLVPEALRFSGDVVPTVESLFRLQSGEAVSIPVFGLLMSLFEYISSPAVLGPARQLIYAAILLGMLWVRREQVSLKARTF